jgi:hypothetical protein
LTQRTAATLALLIALVLAIFVPVPAEADTGLEEVIRDRAAAPGVTRQVPRLLRVARCESSMGYFWVGDGGRSHGPWMLNDLPTGLVWHFYAVGYTNPYSWWQSTDYVVRVASGEWAEGGVTLARWSCR